MSEQRRGEREGEEEPRIKVVDRRRFKEDGEPVPEEPRKTSEAEPAAAPAPSAEGEARLAAQAARIDELSRAYAALVEDNKAFRNRLEREKDRVVEAERGRVILVLLEALDELERAL